MKKLMIVFSLLCFSVAYADYSTAVEHSHNNRSHSHQLPAEGVLHRHGIGQLGVSTQSDNKITSSTKIISSQTSSQSNYKPPKTLTNSSSLHSHSGRSHDHALPGQGVYHKHGGGAIGQAANTNKSDSRSNITIRFSNNSAPTYSTSRADVRNNTSKDRLNDRGWGQHQGIEKYTKGTRCSNGKDCNECAVNVKQQFQKAASQQINWSRKRWDFNWPKTYPPKNIRPLDIFDGDAKYALGIPDTHIQGFVKTNSYNFPYVGSHSHKSKGGIFVVDRNNTLSSLHKTSGRHPSGVHIIGKYLIYGEKSKLFFKDLDSKNQNRSFSLNAKGANFGGGLGVIKLSENNHLLITTGPGGQKSGVRYNRFYHLKSSKGRPSSLRLINRSSVSKPNQWPKSFGFSENMSLITECGTRDVYAVHTTGDEQGISAISGKGYWRLSKLSSNGEKLGLTPVNAFTTAQDMKRCNARASATVSVNQQNRMEFICHGYAKDPDGSGFNVLGKSSRNKDKFYYNVGIVR